MYLSYLLTLDSDTDKITTNIFNHYVELKNNNFFNDWNLKADELDINIPIDDDIRQFISNLINNYVIKFKNVPLIINHDNFYNKKIVKCPYKNEFSCEHIFDIAKIESYIGDSIVEKNYILNTINQCRSIPNEAVIQFLIESFTENKSESANEIVLDKIILENNDNQNTALFRFVNNNLKDNDCKNKETLLNYIKELNTNNFEFCDMPDEIDIYAIPDNILVALDIWKPEKDFRVKKYSHLIKEVQNYWRTKTDIITDYLNEKQNKIISDDVSKDTDWGNFV